METCRTSLRSICTYMNETTVTALPYCFFFLLEYRFSFDILQESQISFFMCLFSNGNVTMIDGSVRTVGYLAVNNSTINNSKMRLWWLDKKY